MVFTCFAKFEFQPDAILLGNYMTLSENTVPQNPKLQNRICELGINPSHSSEQNQCPQSRHRTKELRLQSSQSFAQSKVLLLLVGEAGAMRASGSQCVHTSNCFRQTKNQLAQVVRDVTRHSEQAARVYESFGPFLRSWCTVAVESDTAGRRLGGPCEIPLSSKIFLHHCGW